MPWLTAWRLWPHLNCCDEEVFLVDGPAIQFLEKMTTVVMGWWVLVFWARRFSLFFAANGGRGVHQPVWFQIFLAMQMNSFTAILAAPSL